MLISARTVKMFFLIFALLFFGALCFSHEEKLVEIFLFTSFRCQPCFKVKQEVIPQIQEKYGNKIIVKEFEMHNPESTMKLMELQNKYNWHPQQNSTPTLFINGKFLVGSRQIKDYLEIYIEQALSEKHISSVEPKPTVDLVERFKQFSPWAIVAAGLLDGINPCAFTVIIFFISFLTLQGYGRKRILSIGLSFVLAVFIAYVLIGLGIFNFIFQLKAYPVIVRIVYLAGALLCFILASLAFYDFWKFKRNHQTQDLVLQLPQAIKNRIHGIIGLHFRKGKEIKPDEIRILKLVSRAFIAGFLVSFFEAICTGQVYLPTIVYVLKYTNMKLLAFSYLLFYNLMFILPLLIIMFLALWGTSSQQFAAFAQKHMGTVKILMGILFLGLGFFLILI